MFVFLFINTKFVYTIHRHILFKRKILFWIQIIAINLLTALVFTQQYLSFDYIRYVRSCQFSFRSPKFSISFFLSLSHSQLENLYRLRHPRCAPQSSVDGLEDMEVSLCYPASFLLWMILSLSSNFICFSHSRAEEVQNTTAHLGDSWRSHLGFGRRRPWREGGRRCHHGVRVGACGAGSLPGRRWQHAGQTGALPIGVLWCILPGLKVRGKNNC